MLVVIDSDQSCYCCVGCGQRLLYVSFFFFQAEDGIRVLVRSRGLGDVYKRQPCRGDRPADPDREHVDRRDLDRPDLRGTPGEHRDLSLIHI